MSIKNLYIGDTNNAIDTAFFIAKLFGIISPNINNKKVTIHVDIQIAADFSIHIHSAIPSAIVVAKAAVYVFTRLFPIKIVISNLSLFSLIFLRETDPNFHSLISASIL
jgi:hypothetical protein